MIILLIKTSHPMSDVTCFSGYKTSYPMSDVANLQELHSSPDLLHQSPTILLYRVDEKLIW